MSARAFVNCAIVAATNDWDGVRMADRQLAESLAAHLPVLYLDPPTSFVSRFRRSGWRGLAIRGRLTITGPHLARLKVDALPGLERPGVSRINSLLIAAQARRAVRRLRGSVRATIDANILTPVMGRCGEQRKIYWAQDDWLGLAPLVGTDPRAFAAAETAACASADVIIAANPSVAHALRTDNQEPLLIPFGCDYDLFASSIRVEAAQDVTLSGPVAVFMGHLGDRIDMEIFEAVAAAGVSLLLVGPVHPRTDPKRFADIVARPNVQWVGEQPFDGLPRYLAHGTVGLLPYTASRFNVGSFPLKTLEYLAAGLPVVATPLPALDWLACTNITVRDKPHDFVQAVVALLASGRTEIVTHQCQEFASRHSWASRAKAFADAIERRPARAGEQRSIDGQ